MYYKVSEIEDSKFKVEVFGDGDNIPFLLQPHYPSGETFDSYDEAEIWAKYFVEQDETKMYPPSGKGDSPMPMPTPEELEALRSQMP